MTTKFALVIDEYINDDITKNLLRDKYYGKDKFLNQDFSDKQVLKALPNIQSCKKFLMQWTDFLNSRVKALDPKHNPNRFTLQIREVDKYWYSEFDDYYSLRLHVVLTFKEYNHDLIQKGQDYLDEDFTTVLVKYI